jgi:hypothetical protein
MTIRLVVHTSGLREVTGHDVRTKKIGMFQIDAGVQQSCNNPVAC